MFVSVAAYSFSAAVILVVVIQFALALGAPWGHLAMGGYFPGKLPLKMRIRALIQAMLLLLLSTVVLVKARIILQDFYESSTIGIWIVVGTSCVSLVMNLITKSKWERILWAPVALIIVASSLVVTLG